MRIVKIFIPFFLLSLFSLCPFLPEQLPAKPTLQDPTIINTPTGDLNSPATKLTPTPTITEILSTPTITNIVPTPTPQSLFPVNLKEITVDNIQTLAVIGEIPYPQIQPDHLISNIIPSNDGTKLAIISENWENRKQALVVWDLITNSQLFTIEDPPYFLQWVYFPPDNQELWVFSGDSFDQYDLQSGVLDNSIDFYLTDAVGVSPDGKYFLRGIYVGVDDTSIIRFYDFDNDEPLYTEEMAYMIRSFDFSPDSRMVAGTSATIGGTATKIWDIESGTLLKDLYDYDYGPTFSADSTLAVFGKGNEFSIFSTESWVLKKTFQNKNTTSTNSPSFFLAEDQILAIQETTSVTLNDVNTGEELLELPEQVTVVTFSTTLKIIFTNSSGENIKLWGILQ